MTACADFKLRVWNPVTGELCRVLTGHEALPTQVAFHRDGQLFASVSWDGTTRLWDVDTGDALVTLQETGDDLRFSDDGTEIGLLTGTDWHPQLLNVASDRVCRFLREPETKLAKALSVSPSQVAFSPDERLLAAACHDGVRLWDWERGAEAALLLATNCFAVSFDRTGLQLVAFSEHGVVTWPVNTTSNRFEFGPPQTVSASGGHYRRGALSEDGEVLAYSHDDHVSVQRVGAARLWQFFINESHQIALSPNHRWLAVRPIGLGPAL